MRAVVRSTAPMFREQLKAWDWDRHCIKGYLQALSEKEAGIDVRNKGNFGLWRSIAHTFASRHK